ncbi:MipA/OmpV family protein [Thalassotalea atypica]|uniref:MipA/OmpV family protein n=1 Tax=Thalassotalea atypica TaxID=2054316 RepID=UPI002573DB46|nr:MipA/OmpV family protein [Thalassotalea atypica]
MIKRLTLAIGLISTSVFATSTIGELSEIPDSGASKNKGFHGQVGIAAASLAKYVGSGDNETRALPLINVNYNDIIYFKYNRLGAWLFKSESNFRVGALISPHRGIDEDDLPNQLEGYGDRDPSIMAGFNMGFNQGRFRAEVAALKDVSDNSEGTKLQAQVGYTFLANKHYTLSASAKIESLDDDMVGYYYESYDSATNYSVSLVGTYRLSPKWTLMGAVTTTSLDDEISNSAIVDDDTPTTALIGATYSF